MRNHLFIGILAASFLMGACAEKKEKSKEGDPATEVQAPEPEKQSARPTHWGYEGDDGPSNWASLDPVYATCGNGKHQSPVNIVRSDVGEGVTFSFDYKKAPSFHIAHNEHMEEIIDNGHTIQVTVEEGSEVTINGKAFALKQFHFHTPSEHTIDGEHYPMEMHMVHQSPDKSLAVVAVLFEEGEVPNENFNEIIAHIPASKGDAKHVSDTDLEIKAALPSEMAAYHYVGSLTTPPCSENVQWLVLRKPFSLTPEQIEAFSSKIAKNNRPVQALNDRMVRMDEIGLGIN